METIISIILTIISIKYSSKYHIKKIGKAKKKFMVIEKIAHGTKDGYIDSARIALVKSSVDNALGFMDVSLTTHIEDIKVDRYAFIHSFIHNIFAPGKIILSHKNSWKENAPSNSFENYQIISKKLDTIPIDLIDHKIRKNVKECRAIKSTFIYPDTYTGPRYKDRLIIIARNIGIVYSETNYINKDKDVYILVNYKIRNTENYWFPVNNIGNVWEYEIKYDYGANQLNINC